MLAKFMTGLNFHIIIIFTQGQDVRLLFFTLSQLQISLVVASFRFHIVNLSLPIFW